MKALTRLKSTVMFQAAGVEEAASKMTDRARTLVAFGVLVAAALAAAPNAAHAQSSILTPGNCATVGGTIGGLVGSQAGKTNVSNAIGAALGALGGAAAGNWLCSPSERSQDSSYSHAANYGVDGGTKVSPSTPKQALSITERERLDDMAKSAIDAKWAWKKSLWEVDQAKSSGFGARLNSAMEAESQARQTFDQERGKFSTTVAKLNNGVDGAAPRAVGRYIEISASLLELTTEAKVSYQMLEARDMKMQERSPAYKEAADQASRMRNRG
jgi:hypothetical protein